MRKNWLLSIVICFIGILCIPINAKIIDSGDSSKTISIAEEIQNDKSLNEQEFINKALQCIEKDESFYAITDLEDQLMFDGFTDNERGKKTCFNQYIDGNIVSGGHLCVFFYPDGRFREITGRIISHAQDFDTSGVITGDQALQIIRDDLSSRGSEIVRTYFNDLVVYDENGCYRDVWIITVVPSNSKLGLLNYSIDAETGDILKLEYDNHGINTR